MIEANRYIEIVKEYFHYLETEFGFKCFKEKIKGNAFYNIEFRDETRIVSISYENIEDYFQVIIYKLYNGELPDFDDRRSTLHLKSLLESVFSNITKAEIDANNKHFENYRAKDSIERKILKSAKELRLCLLYSKG